MDPEAALAIVTDPLLPLSERAEAAVNLLAWLANGGAPPVRTHRSQAGVVEQCKLVMSQVLDALDADPVGSS